MRSGSDFASNHFPPNTPYYQGNFPYAEFINPSDCQGTFQAAAFCNDWNVGMWPDPPSNKLVGDFISPSGDHTYYAGNVWAELEQWQLPVGYRPEPGDRAILAGRLIQDCGHDDNHFELHPLEATASTFLQTAPLERYEPLPPVVCAFGICRPVPDNSGKMRLGNLPNISDQWATRTNGNPATITKIAVTQDWQGEDLTFELWPPARPNVAAQLHWINEYWRASDAINIEVTPMPTENPNHIIVHVSHNGPVNQLWTSVLSPDAVVPGPDKESASSFMLWWEIPAVEYYTAVWRPSTEGEIQVYGWRYEDYRAKYDELWSQGWRLKLLDTYRI
jgi:hypothetical protein